MPEKMTIDMLGDIVIEVLQDAAFIFAEPLEEMAPVESGKMFAKLGFTGPSNGDMFISCPPNLATDFAANLLGIEPDAPEAEEKRGDALGEMLNIVGGALLARWFGVSEEFEMGVPSVADVDPSQYGKATENAMLMLPLITDEGDHIEIGIIS